MENINTVNQNIDPEDYKDDESLKKELVQLLEQKKQIEENKIREKEEEEKLKIELEKHIEDVRINLNIFLSWMKNSLLDENTYKSFKKDFNPEYCSKLFDNICEFFKDNSFVTDEILFYWKFMVICLLRTSKKYKSLLGNLTFDLEKRETNLRIVKEKYIFRCFIDENHICYFKENGTDYYVS